VEVISGFPKKICNHAASTATVIPERQLPFSSVERRVLPRLSQVFIIGSVVSKTLNTS
jgi:hypothetical protein